MIMPDLGFWHWCSNINMFVDDAPLKSAPASWPFRRGSRQPATGHASRA
jgi:hypothetical protein